MLPRAERFRSRPARVRPTQARRAWPCAFHRKRREGPGFGLAIRLGLFRVLSSEEVRSPCHGIDLLQSRQHFFPTWGIEKTTVPVEFDIADHHVATSGAAVDRNEPMLLRLAKRWFPRKCQMSNIIKQVISDAIHGVHIFTPRYAAPRQAVRKSSKEARRSGPSAGSWKTASP